MAADPVDKLTHHWPVCKTRPMMSVLPSPLKSPTLTSTQVTLGLQVVQRLQVKLEPVLRPTHHSPPAERPATSVKPSPLKSPCTTCCQLAAGLQLPQA